MRIDITFYFLLITLQENVFVVLRYLNPLRFSENETMFGFCAYPFIPNVHFPPRVNEHVIRFVSYRTAQQ